MQRSIWLVIPAYREERLLPRTLRRVPACVDGVVVVDDASPDATSRAAREAGDARLVLERHPRNLGVGAAIRTGYRRALSEGADLIIVMAADDQMDPADLPALAEPILADRADYVKGNRLIHPDKRRMPLARRAAGHALGWLTARATGYALSDSQCGYTAISAAALRVLPLDELWPRYGYPNDLLGLLSQARLRVAEVPVRPIYADEASGVRPWHFLTVCWLIARRYAVTKRGRT
ncbi:MAG: glycosyltransferase family 2 protein [Polyangiaceae bacterium]|nr:glycosyltransferase family 2 protein [Polyangiaceae bacterium]MCW5789011.1 glycosyltransferase family 2 protein [Polyangiaceae bacterium]